MLLSVLPVAMVSSAILPQVDSFALLLVVLVLADKHAAIAPLVCSFTMHHIVLPVSQEHPVVVPYKEAFAIEHVVAPLANISVTIWPAVFTLALLRGILVETLILTAIVPFFLSKAMLFVLVPVSDIL